MHSAVLNHIEKSLLRPIQVQGLDLLLVENTVICMKSVGI